jgi:hypothetical protein
MKQATAEYVRENFRYEPETGRLLRRTRKRGGVFEWREVMTKHSGGYYSVNIFGSPQLAHRIAWLHYYGEAPIGCIDHINGIRTDNRITNLRDVSQSKNMHNMGSARSDSKTGVLGVSANRGRWRARISINKIHRHIGTFDTQEEAFDAYAQAKRDAGLATARLCAVYPKEAA